MVDYIVMQNYILYDLQGGYFMLPMTILMDHNKVLRCLNHQKERTILPQKK